MQLHGVKENGLHLRHYLCEGNCARRRCQLPPGGSSRETWKARHAWRLQEPHVLCQAALDLIAQPEIHLAASLREALIGGV